MSKVEQAALEIIAEHYATTDLTAASPSFQSERIMLGQMARWLMEEIEKRVENDFGTNTYWRTVERELFGDPK